MTGNPQEFSFVNFETTLKELFSLTNLGVKLGLDNMRLLMAQLGNPENNIEFIHIAGTNGKGSTAAILSTILQDNNLKTARFTSPHLISINERFSINSINISNQEFLLHAKTIHQASLAIIKKGGLYPTFFEFMTALAIVYFEKEKCDVVVWETGLGGRLDATNIVPKVLALITNIDLEHTEYLGQSLISITKEKCGITTPQCQVITTIEKKDCLNVLRTYSQNVIELKMTSELKSKNDYFGLIDKNGQTILKTSQYGQIAISLRGLFQCKNGYLALMAAVWYLKSKNITLAITDIKRSFSRVRWRGRFDLFSQFPTIFVDCAHNAAGIDQLVLNLKELSIPKWIFIVGGLNDKNLSKMISSLIPFAKELWYTEPSSERAVSTEDFKLIVQELDIQIPVRYFKNAKTAVRHISKDSQFIVTGSCYLVGAILPELEELKQEGYIK